MQRSGSGRGYTHLAWGDAELRFAQQMHELEYGLRTSLVALYRALRDRERVAGEELEHLLRGDGAHARPARLAGRLIRVLAELELVSLDRDLPALALAGEQPTELERSAAYRAYTHRVEDGQRFLSRAQPTQRPEADARDRASDGRAADGACWPIGDSRASRSRHDPRPSGRPRPRPSTRADAAPS